MSVPAEFSLIYKHFRPLAGPGALALGDDASFYAAPRFTQHLDAQCRADIATLYGRLLQPGMKVLDLMSSGDSHLPAEIGGLEVSGLGMNAAELDANPCLAERRVQQPQGRWLLSGEDLTCQAGLAVQQDTLLAASLGVAHIERNGHHYVDGFGTAPAAEAQAFLAAHPGLYHLQQGRVRLRVADGELDLRSLHGSGFASDALPLWDRLQAIT